MEKETRKKMLEVLAKSLGSPLVELDLWNEIHRHGLRYEKEKEFVAEMKELGWELWTFSRRGRREESKVLIPGAPMMGKRSWIWYEKEKGLTNQEFAMFKEKLHAEWWKRA